MATIVDIAKACGTSKATVSKVMNGNDHKISHAKRALIRHTIEQMNYQPSAMARGLSKRRTNTIGIVTPNVWHILSLTYYATLIGAVLDEARARLQTVSVFNSNVWNPDVPGQLVFGDGRCDGLVLIGVNDESILAGLQRSSIPYVLVNGGRAPEGGYSIDIDNIETAKTVTRHLLAHGHRRIGYFDCADTRIFFEQRFHGYRTALDEAGAEFDPRFVFDGSHLYESGYDRGKQVAAMPELGITALFCATDLLALAAMRGLADAGVGVPGAISIVGINGLVDGERSSPRLTTMSQSLEKLGDEAVRLLLEIVDGADSAPRHIVWPTELIVRDSVVQRENR